MDGWRFGTDVFVGGLRFDIQTHHYARISGPGNSYNGGDWRFDAGCIDGNLVIISALVVLEVR